MRRALVVTDEVLARLGLPDPVVAAIRDAGVEAEVYAAPAGEPSVASMQAAAEHAQAGGYDGFVGLGGGSALDTVKAAALLATHGGEILDWVNPPIGGGRAVPGPLLPVVALPTTAGTGSEVTAVAVLDVPEHRVKTGISHQHLRPRLAICDPELTVGCPPAVTAAVGLDALMHAIEAYVSLPYDARPRPDDPGARPPYQGANPLADVWVERAIELGGRYLRRAVADGSDLEARHGMLQCATFAGIGFGNAGVHVPHACSYPIAGLRHDWAPPGFPGPGRGVPHGIAVIVTAVAGLRLTAPVLPERHARAAELLTGEPVDAGDLDALPRAIARLIADVGAPRPPVGPRLRGGGRARPRGRRAQAGAAAEDRPAARRRGGAGDRLPRVALGLAHGQPRGHALRGVVRDRADQAVAADRQREGPLRLRARGDARQRERRADRAARGVEAPQHEVVLLGALVDQHDGARAGGDDRLAEGEAVLRGDDAQRGRGLPDGSGRRGRERAERRDGQDRNEGALHGHTIRARAHSTPASASRSRAVARAAASSGTSAATQPS